MSLIVESSFFLISNTFNVERKCVKKFSLLTNESEICYIVRSLYQNDTESDSIKYVI